MTRIVFHVPLGQTTLHAPGNRSSWGPDYGFDELGMRASACSVLLTLSLWTHIVRRLHSHVNIRAQQCRSEVDVLVVVTSDLFIVVAQPCLRCPGRRCCRILPHVIAVSR